MSSFYEFTVSEESDGLRIDKAVYLNFDGEYSRSTIQNWIDEAYLLLCGNRTQKSACVKSGDRISIYIPDSKMLNLEPQNIPLDIFYEDDDIIVVNKNKGLVVHPACGNLDGTLVNALLYHCGKSLSGINGVSRPGILHRIDKNTSGLLVAAKNDTAHMYLSDQIKAHSTTREYRAVVYGRMRDDEGTIDAPIGRSERDRKKMCVTEKNSKPAVTHYTVLERYRGFTYVKCVLETGRTHQIRVHMSSIGHPLAGDDVYGPKNVITSLSGQCLHAARLGFIHPSGRYMEFFSSLPDYFKAFLKQLTSE